MLLNVGISKGDEITAGLIKMRAVSGDEVHILDIYVEELREKEKDQRKWILKARNMLISLLDKKKQFFPGLLSPNLILEESHEFCKCLNDKVVEGENSKELIPWA